ncbi:4-hydroxybenzoyl-CoA thioesterase/acyl-CoA thioester hydrolase [Alteromonadaceae bacterium 2753L.S.0a.02]|nr:4-hydroxybenzoyl-CoA thioesterase/acyl-CoA thioester hydrolase [Alteromonadaceae bacterium 2753L.S.0a.02]
MKEFSVPLRVYIEDTDAGGIVYYANYLKFMERARTELLRSFGFGKAATPDSESLLVVASADIKYLAPARLDDELLVTANFQKVAKTYLVFTQQVLCNSRCLCTAQVKVASVSKDTMKPSPLPSDLVAALKNFWGNPL